MDSRTPGYDQLGTVWLPLLHVICLPLVGNDWLWVTGLAGALPVAVCFVIAGLFFYLAAKLAYGSLLAAATVLLCFALNPNVLYLGSIPMTEIVFLAAFAVFLFALFRFRQAYGRKWIALGVLASWCMSLTRYDGWFLIPFAAIAFATFSPQPRWSVLVAFGGLASLAPLFWLAHNWWETSNPLDFYNGPYSAWAIQGDKPYPGYHNWFVAVGYYAVAAELCAGWCLTLLGLAGVVCAFKKRVFAPISLLLLPPLFYVWSLHSSRNPIFVPQLPPHGYYNTRYGIAAVALAGFAAGAIVLALPPKWKRFAFVVPLLSLAPWLLRPSKQNWVCWKESQINSRSRLAWTNAAAEFLRTNYRGGQGILIVSGTGDISGILCRAGIPLREALHIGNGPAWYAHTIRPDLVHRQRWAIAQSGDTVSKMMRTAGQPIYRLSERIEVHDAPALQIFERHDIPEPR